MSDIFVSYARKDRNKAEILAKALSDYGWTVWWDRTIPAGQTFAAVIEEALANAKCVMVLWSSNSVSSNWVHEEAEEGRRKEMLIPVSIENVRPPIGFRSIQAADLTDWNGVERTQSLEKLLADITNTIGPPLNLIEDKNITSEEKKHKPNKEAENKVEEQKISKEKAERKLKLTSGKGVYKRPFIWGILGVIFAITLIIVLIYSLNPDDVPIMLGLKDNVSVPITPRQVDEKVGTHILKYDKKIVAYYPFNGNANDESGNKNHGVRKGVTMTADRYRNVNGAFRFDGKNNYIDCGKNERYLNSIYNGITVEAWVNHNSGNGHIVNQGGGWYDNGYSLFWYKNSIRIELQDNSHGRKQTVVDNPAPSDGMWHHIAFTWDIDSKKIMTYIDGVRAENIGTFQGPIGIPNQNLNIGRNENKRNELYFDGIIDEVTIYNYALTADKIAEHALYLNSGLVAYYPFIGNAKDVSGNKNHGRVYGAKLTTDRFGISNSAYYFDGKNDYIKVTDDDSLDLTTNYTLSLWMLQKDVDATRGYRILDKITGGRCDGWLLDTYDGNTGRKLRLISCPSPVAQSKAYTLNEWHHIVVTVSGTTANFYFDGEYDKSDPVGAGSAPKNKFDLFIGASQCNNKSKPNKVCGDNYFKGIIDEIRIYKRVLSKAEIKELYAISKEK